MKMLSVSSRIIKMIFIILILSSCYILPELPDWVIPLSFSTIDDALNYVKDIKYSDNSSDNWNTPEETYKRGWGDCADLSLLLAHILFEKLDLSDTEVLMGFYNDKGHAWVSVKKRWYEPQLGTDITGNFSYIVSRRFDYESALRKADGDW